MSNSIPPDFRSEPSAVRVLQLEEDRSDAELVRRELERAGIPISLDLACGEGEFHRALGSSRYDVILSDCSISGWSGFDAFRAVRRVDSEVPFILVTDSMGEELAVAHMKKGITDIVFKRDLARLPAAIEQAIRERVANAQLHYRQALLNEFMENSPDFIYFKDLRSRFIRISRAHAAAFGLNDPTEAIGKSGLDFYSEPFATDELEDEQVIVRTGKAIVNKEEHARLPGGREAWLLTSKMPLRNIEGKIVGTFGISRNISELKHSEIQLRQRVAELEAVNQISRATRSAHTLGAMLPELLRLTLGVMGLTRGAIWLHDPLENDLRAAAALGYEGDGLKQLLEAESGMAGSASLAFASGSPNIIVDLHADSRIPDTVRSVLPAGAFSIAVPLRATDDLVIGTMSVGGAPPRAVDSNDVSLLTTVSEMTGSAIHRMRLHEQTEHRLRQVAALREIDKAIATSFDLQRNLQAVLTEVIALLKGDAAIVFTFNPVSGLLEYAADSGFPHESIIKTTNLRLGEGMAGRAALNRRMLCEPNIRGNPEFARLASLEDGRFTSCACAPLMTKGQVRGVLEVLHCSRFEPTGEWTSFFEALAGQAAIVIENSQLFESTQRSKDELTMAYDATIEGWSRALDLRDKETEGHSQRVTAMTCKMASALGMSEEDLARVRWGSLLHDIGKMGIPDSILFKTGPLTEEEWGVMRRHPVFAFEMLAPIEYLKNAIDIPYCHHERWDGAGYPRGLKGAQIPISARLFAVVDVWDALTSDRPYRKAWSTRRVLAHIQGLAGSHFDPRAVEIFLDVLQS